jgi:hypothetical protein
VYPPISIQYADIAARTPARCNRKTGEIYLNINRWGSIKPQHKVYILLHEIGHIVLNTSNELAVDKWAQEQYVQAGYPLTESVLALTQVLSGDTEEQVARATQSLNIARQFDMNLNEHVGAMEDSFLGKLAKDIFTTKEGRERRQRVREERRTKTNNRKDLKTEATYILARDYGVSEKAIKKANTSNQLGGALGAVTSITGSLLGGGAATGAAGEAIAKAFTVNEDGVQVPIEQNSLIARDTSRAPGPTKKWYQTTGAMVGIVCAGIGVVIAVVLWIRNRKK